MGYEVDYAAGEKEGCSSKLTIEHRIFYVKLFASPAGFAKYYGGNQHGVLKEISRMEFDLWLKILADNEQEIKDIKKKISLGKKYAL
jgi:hypothetical protein